MKGEWKHVENGDEEAQGDDLRACRSAALALLLSLDTLHRGLVRGMKCPKRIWETLKAYCVEEGRDDAILIMDELESAKQLQGESMKQYFGRMINLRDRLMSVAGEQASPEAVFCLKVLRGTDPAYKSQILTLLSNGGADEIKKLRTALQTLEKHARTMGLGPTSRHTLHTETALNSNDNKSGGGRSARFGGTCYKCLKTGHRAQHCRGTANTAAKYCSHCKWYGHRTDQCRKRTKKEENREERAMHAHEHIDKHEEYIDTCMMHTEETTEDEGYLTEETTDTEEQRRRQDCVFVTKYKDKNTDIWYIGTCCTTHMSPIKPNIDYKETNYSHIVGMGNAATSKAEGVGSMVMMLPDGSYLKLKRVLWVPQLQYNLLSHGAIRENGGLADFGKRSKLRLPNGKLLAIHYNNRLPWVKLTPCTLEQVRRLTLQKDTKEIAMAAINKAAIAADKAVKRAKEAALKAAQA